MVHRLRVHLRLRDGPPVLDMGRGKGTPLWRKRTEDAGRRRVPGDDAGAERKSDRVKWMHACRSLARSGLVLRRDDDGALCSYHDKYRDSLCGRVLRLGGLVSALHRSRGAILAPGILPRALEAACRQMPPVFLLTARLKKAGFALFDVETFLVQPDLQDLFLCTAANIVPPLPRSRRARRHLHLRHPGRERGDPYRIGMLGGRYRERPDRSGTRSLRQQSRGFSILVAEKEDGRGGGDLSRVFPGPPVASGWYPWVISGLMFSVVG